MTLKTSKIFPRNGQVSGAQGGIIQVVSSTTTAADTNSTAARPHALYIKYLWKGAGISSNNNSLTLFT